MKILVTGAHGFVGRNFVSQLRNIRDGKARNYALSGEELEIFEYDVDTDPSLLDDYCRQADFVFNLAGVNRPKDTSEFMKGNFGFASTLLETLKERLKGEDFQLVEQLLEQDLNVRCMECECHFRYGFSAGLLLVQVDETDEGLCAAFNAEAAVECGMIVFGLSPVALGVEVVIGRAVAVGHLDVGFCFGLAALFTFHDAADALRQWGVDEKVQAVGVLAQDVVGAAAYDDARPGVGHLADDLALRKEHLVRQRHGLRQEAVVLVAQYARHTVFQIFNDLGGESRNGSR